MVLKNLRKGDSMRETADEAMDLAYVQTQLTPFSWAASGKIMCTHPKSSKKML